MKVTKIFKWHCSHLLTHHEGLCKNLHGHTYKLEVEVEGTTQKEGRSRGMVIDFGDLKSVVNNYVVDKFDHALIINKSNLEVIKFAQSQDWKLMQFPGETTAENMAEWIFTQLKNLKAHPDFKVIRVRLYETETSYAEVTK